MFKKASIFVCLLLAGGLAQAAATKTAPVVAPSVPDLAPASPETLNPHMQRDKKLRDCHAQAAQQNLVGDAERKFIASCFKKP